jgi:hypothetical protein
MIAGVIEFLRSEQSARVVIAVPTHPLGEGLAGRINNAYGAQVAAEWYGTGPSILIRWCPEKACVGLRQRHGSSLPREASRNFCVVEKTEKCNTVLITLKSPTLKVAATSASRCEK